MLYLNRIQKCTAIAQTIFHEKTKESCSYDKKIEDMQIQLKNKIGFGAFQFLIFVLSNRIINADVVKIRYLVIHTHVIFLI
jgi:hypothetical protein